MCVHVNIVYVRKEQSRKIETKIERKVEREHMIREMRGQDDNAANLIHTDTDNFTNTISSFQTQTKI